MKCFACGYIYERVYNIDVNLDSTLVQSVGDEEFLETMQDVYFFNKGKSNPILKSIYACPKCGIMQIKVNT